MRDIAESRIRKEEKLKYDEELKNKDAEINKATSKVIHLEAEIEKKISKETESRFEINKRIEERASETADFISGKYRKKLKLIFYGSYILSSLLSLLVICFTNLGLFLEVLSVIVPAVVNWILLKVNNFDGKSLKEKIEDKRKEVLEYEKDRLEKIFFGEKVS